MVDGLRLPFPLMEFAKAALGSLIFLAAGNTAFTGGCLRATDYIAGASAVASFFWFIGLRCRLGEMMSPSPFQLLPDAPDAVNAFDSNAMSSSASAASAAERASNNNSKLLEDDEATRAFFSDDLGHELISCARAFELVCLQRVRLGLEPPAVWAPSFGDNDAFLEFARHVWRAPSLAQWREACARQQQLHRADAIDWSLFSAQLEHFMARERLSNRVQHYAKYASRTRLLSGVD